MNTLWLKLAGLAVAVVVAIVLVGILTSGGSKPAEPEGGYWGQVEKDDVRLRAAPQQREPAAESGGQGANVPASNQNVTVQPEKAVAPNQESTITEAASPKFKEMSLEEEAEAGKLFEMALAQRKMGRLPVMGYGQMVRYCREIIHRWPESEYAFKAKRMLSDIPERYRKMYDITAEEIDLGKFK